jgi:hypothetical protein
MKQKKYTQEERIKKLEQVVTQLYLYHQTTIKELQLLKAELKDEKKTQKEALVEIMQNDEELGLYN